MFLGTFLIGLREGLEAALIVGIIATFLKRNNQSLRPMFIGVGLAIAISIAVGVSLDILAQSLPQAQQEMLETVIGAVAVVFVTSMIIWMKDHGRDITAELEDEARTALNSGSALALAVMAFLAVLKEGFETAVFLLAVIQASQDSQTLALVGAIVGILVAVGLGIGLYYGGLKLNIGKFFQITGAFLIVVAGGLVMSALRTAHEAGWITIGQQQVFDFSGWMPKDSVQGALITGIFGIQTDPRLIEVLGWLLYVIPVLTIYLWPSRWNPAADKQPQYLLGAAGGLLALAAGLFIFIPATGVQQVSDTQSIVLKDGAPPADASAKITGSGETRDLQTQGVQDATALTLDSAGTERQNNIDYQVWQKKIPTDSPDSQTTVTLDELLTLNGNRLPVGLSVDRTPGPFNVTWAATIVYSATTYAESLVGAESSSTRIATLRGGGLSGTKTVSLGALPGDWTVPQQTVDANRQAIQTEKTDRAERSLWRVWLPAVFLIASIGLAITAWRTRSRNQKNNQSKVNTKDGSARETENIHG